MRLRGVVELTRHMKKNTTIVNKTNFRAQYSEVAVRIILHNLNAFLKDIFRAAPLNKSFIYLQTK